MNLFYQAMLIEQTIWVPVLLCIIRRKNVFPRYFPLLAYLLVRALLELGGNLWVLYQKFFVQQPTFNNQPFYNLLYLSEAVLLTWQLYRLDAFNRQKRPYLLLQGFWLVLWVADNFLIGTFNAFNLIFHTTYSSILLLVTTALIGKLAVGKKQLYNSPDFGLCIAFGLWFIYNIFYCFSKYLVVQNKDLYNISKDIIAFMEFSALIFYLLIAWIIVRVPSRRNIHSY
jgi:hypothetical protein